MNDLDDDGRWTTYRICLTVENTESCEKELWVILIISFLKRASVALERARKFEHQSEKRNTIEILGRKRGPQI